MRNIRGSITTWPVSFLLLLLLFAFGFVRLFVFTCRAWTELELGDRYGLMNVSE
jgi:hypothetical protein